MTKLENFLSEVRAKLSSHGIENAEQESRWIFEEALSCDQTFLRLNAAIILPPTKVSLIETMLKRRLSDEPLAYIFGKQNFFGLDFKVTPAVLIPRFDTETLVEKALELLRDRGPHQVVDIGTGSGCIAITLKKHLPQCQFWAWDISPDALSVAKENAVRILGADHGIIFELKDGVDEKNWQDCPFDMVLTNPPYIGINEAPSLAPSVRNYEPHLALFSGEDGLEFYQKLFKILPRSAKNKRSLLLECGHQQAGKLQEILTHWRFSGIEVYQDYRGIARGLKATF